MTSDHGQSITKHNRFTWMTTDVPKDKIMPIDSPRRNHSYIRNNDQQDDSSSSNNNNNNNNNRSSIAGNNLNNHNSFVGPMHYSYGSPEDVLFLNLPRHAKLASSTFRHVTRVSKRAALATKAQIWDSNDASIVAAQSAVDLWEQIYNALRGLLVASMASAKGVYGAAKAGANGLEHGFLLPIRDWLLLPAFWSAERIASETVGFLQSSQAERVANESLGLVSQIPLVGEAARAALCMSANIVKKTWEIAQYPIPSPSQVRDSVDFVMTGTKWALSTASREIALYVKRADANITRTLSHTQWKVLGSGPYATLDKLNKREVIDHLCERYFSLVDAVARYELAAHIRAHNRPLYHDLVLTGLLRERGGALTEEDEWLSSCPSYRKLESPFLLSAVDDAEDVDNPTLDEVVFPLWYRLPYQNGKRPPRDVPWVAFEGRERRKLEQHYQSILRNNHGDGQIFTLPTSGETPAVEHSDSSNTLSSSNSSSQQPQQQQQQTHNRHQQQRYITNAKWYTPGPADVLVDQKRHAVTFFPCCPKCRRKHSSSVQHPPLAPKQFGELCDACSQRGEKDAPWVDALLSPPPLTAILRPTLWRFYGPGDEVRRAVWFLDTQRHGLQPYGEDAQAVLEDAYLFLKWTTCRRVWDGSILLTVQVPSPDGSEHQLVQFSSLTSATAIGKGLGGAIALFKRRVYRGAFKPTESMNAKDVDDKGNNNDNGNSKRGQVASEPMDPLKASTDITLDHPPGSEEVAPKSQTEESMKKPMLMERRLSLSYEEEDEEENFDDMNVEFGDVAVLEVDESNDPPPELQVTELECTQEEPKEISVEKTTDLNKASWAMDTIDDSDVETVNLESPRMTDEKIEVNPTDQGSTVQKKEQSHDIALHQSQISAAQQPLDNSREQLTLAYPYNEKDAPVEAVENDDHVDHLVLIVHGVGEMLQSIDLFGLSKLPTIVDCCGFLRKNHAEVLDVRFAQLESLQTNRGRVEYLPVEWHEAFTIQSQRRLPTNNSILGNRSSIVTINEISMRSIPQLRQFANDTLMDVLYFMSPEHHDIIIDIVVNEMNVIVQKFRDLTGFRGDISVIGHSLGSIITWDILKDQVPAATLADSESRPSQETFATPETAGSDPDFDDFPSERTLEEDAPECTSPPELADDDDHHHHHHHHGEIAYPQLNFEVDNAFFLGSPIAVFLMIRNQRNPLSEEFALKGCSRVFNIFHPYDPVAYRIEPLIHPRNAEIEPKIMTHCK